MYPDGMSRPSLEDLIDKGSVLVRHWQAIEESKTDVLRDLARIVLQIRSRFRDGDGNRDWAGHSHDYRLTIRRMYDKAGIPPDSEDNIQAALRYHVGNLLRENVPPDELEQCGLLASSPRERLAAARSEVAALVEAMTLSGRKSRSKVPPGARGGKLVAAAAECLEAMDAHVQTAGFDEVVLDEVQTVLDLLAHIRDLCDRLERGALEASYEREPATA